jgi:hypothetical protein
VANKAKGLVNDWRIFRQISTDITNQDFGAIAKDVGSGLMLFGLEDEAKALAVNVAAIQTADWRTIFAVVADDLKLIASMGLKNIVGAGPKGGKDSHLKAEFWDSLSKAREPK